MVTAVRSIYIKAQPEQVWSYLQDPRNMMDWWPNCEELRGLPAGGDGRCKFQWIDKPGGVTCRGEIEEVVCIPGEGIELHLAGDMCGEMRWQVRRENGGAQVTFESDYGLPVRRLIPHLSPIRLLKFQQHEADAIVQRVQERFNGKQSRLGAAPDRVEGQHPEAIGAGLPARLDFVDH